MSGKGDEMYSIPLSSDSDTADAVLGGKVYTNPGEVQPTALGNSQRNKQKGDVGDKAFSHLFNKKCIESDVNADEEEEKQRLISQVLELQNTLDDLSSRVDTVKEENLKLKSENQVLGQYIENLMTASSVFQSTSPKSKKKSGKKKEK